jgi:hypothetical protein
MSGRLQYFHYISKTTKGHQMKMLMDRKYIVRRRYAFALAVVLATVAVWALVQVSTNLWWVGGTEGYCWGDMIECYFPGGK